MSEPSAAGRPLLDKLGVKPGARISVLGLNEPWFDGELGARTNDVHTAHAAEGSDLIIVYVDRREDLDRALAPLERSLKRNGAIWVIRPKGTPHIKETDVIEAGRRAGLVDNKIASFSDTLSAMRLVIPVARR
ncbi:MAG: DUF3052 domain-containing protein [Actinomycetota bacterium]|nr:DUF3052 domain-containing protein [Actinomycetota bacterium]